jgi:hypothetical protein
MRIPLSSPDITDSEVEAVVAVLRTSRLSLGPVTEQFEAAVVNCATVRHAVAVSSGTAGLHLCVRALGLGEGDEVIVPSFTFVATANAIRYERATPVFADIDPATLNIDPRKIEEAITGRTRAILVVHTFGVPADMHRLWTVLCSDPFKAQLHGVANLGKSTGYRARRLAYPGAPLFQQYRRRCGGRSLPHPGRFAVRRQRRPMVFTTRLNKIKPVFGAPFSRLAPCSIVVG